MQPPWTLFGVAPGFTIGAILAATLAVVVYRSRPNRPQNRWLALLLLIEAFSSASWAILNTFQSPALALASYVGGHSFVMLTIAVYPLFLGTLDTPLARPFRNKWVLGVIWAITAACFLFIVTRPHLFLIGPLTIHGAVTLIYGPGGRLLYTIFLLPLLVYALCVIFSVWRRAPKGSALRAQTGIFTVAFAFRDFLFFMNLFGFALLPLLFLPPDLFVSQTGLLVMVWTYHLQIIGFPLIAGYGILKHQLFDIDLKLKWTIGKTTLFAFFVAFFFIVSESAAVFMGDRWGTYAGILAAGLLLFAIVPLQRLAERVADRAMPDVADTPAYLERRKVEVYRATLEEMIADGSVTLKERKALYRLQEGLGIDGNAANRIEAELLRRGKVT